MHRLCALLVLSSAALAQSGEFAARVIAFDDMGMAGGGIFNPANLLGQPDGLVHSLGIGGWATVGFDVVITDGPGADLIITENSFFSGSLPGAFAEMVFVEVSSDGVNFARIPNAYYGPAVSPGPFGVINVAMYSGLAGATPGNPLATDPLDVVDAGGDAIDLADAASDPLVLSGAVDLTAITQLRLVDVRDGVDTDSRGVVIRDPGGGSSDPDGVAVIHHTGNLSPNGPNVDVVVPASGQFSFTIEDPDGLGDLDPASLRMALWGIELPIASLLPALQATRFDATGFTLQLIAPLPNGFPIRVSVSAKDLAGHRAGDTRTRPLN